MIARRPVLGVRARIAILVASVSFLLIGTAGGVLLWRTQSRVMVGVNARASATLNPLATLTAIANSTGDVEQIDDTLAEVTDAASTDMPILYAAFVDFKGNVVTSARPSRVHLDDPFEKPEVFVATAVASREPLWRRYQEPGHGWVLATSAPAVAGIREGTVVVVFGISEIVDAIRTSLFFTALVGAAILLVAIAVMYWGIDLLVVARLNKLSDTASRIQGGERSARTGIRSSDEVGRLAVTFDGMADELQTYTETLEKRVADRTAELVEANRKLEEMARVDALTGAFNRRYFEELIQFEFRRSQRAGHQWCLLIFDLDHFKNVNDTWGHRTGDRVLAGFVAIFQAHLRATDVLARYGGEEFVAVLLDTPRAAGIQVAEKLRTEVEAATFPSADGRSTLKLTVSVGLAAFPDDGTDPIDLLAHADTALYDAKHQGRNRVVAWEKPEASGG